MKKFFEVLQLAVVRLSANCSCNMQNQTICPEPPTECHSVFPWMAARGGDYRSTPKPSLCYLRSVGIALWTTASFQAPPRFIHT